MRSRAFPVVLAFVLTALAACSDGETDSSATATSPPSASASDAPVPSLAAASTEAPSSSESADAGGSFSVNIGEPVSIDPAQTSEIEGSHVIRLLFEPLVKLDRDLNVVAGAATDWSLGDDGVTWTFELDPAGKFSDGTPVTAADFAFAFARAADPDIASASAYQGLPISGWADVMEGEPSGAFGDEPVAGVTIVDDLTLTIATDEPFALLPKVLTYTTFAPVQQAAVATEEDQAAWLDQPIGNGPYMMSEPWNHQVGISLVRNPNFHGASGVAAQIDFKIYADNHTAFVDFQAGNLDIARTVAGGDITTAREQYAATFMSTPAAVLTYWGIPTSTPPYDDPDLRLALSLAIDREAVAERVNQGTTTPADGLVPSQAPGNWDNACEACEYDPERAKELFEQTAGFADNTMIVYDIADDGRAVLEPVVNSWTEVFGVEIEVRSLPWAEYLEAIDGGQSEGPYELGWVWDYPSAYSMLSPLLESTSDANELAWANPEFDELMELTRTAPDEQTGLEHLEQAERIAIEELPLIPYQFSNEVAVHSDRVGNVFEDAGALFRLEDVEVVG